MVNVLAVIDDGLEVLESNGDRTPIAELLEESADEKTMSSEISIDDLRR